VHTESATDPKRARDTERWRDPRPEVSLLFDAPTWVTAFLA